MAGVLRGRGGEGRSGVLAWSGQAAVPPQTVEGPRASLLSSLVPKGP